MADQITDNVIKLLVFAWQYTWIVDYNNSKNLNTWLNKS